MASCFKYNAAPPYEAVADAVDTLLFRMVLRFKSVSLPEAEPSMNTAPPHNSAVLLSSNVSNTEAAGALMYSPPPYKAVFSETVA
jgi:hypothetical protein